MLVFDCDSCRLGSTPKTPSRPPTWTSMITGTPPLLCTWTSLPEPKMVLAMPPENRAIRALHRAGAVPKGHGAWEVEGRDELHVVLELVIAL